MKKIPFIPSISFVTLKGEPFLIENKQIVVTDVEFLLERTAENGICGDRKGYQQIAFTESMRQSINEQAKDAETRGFWELEDAHYEALKAHLSTAKLEQSLLHNLAPFLSRFFSG